MNKRLIYFAFTIFLCIVITDANGQNILLMPEELYELAKDQSCEQIEDYYLNSINIIKQLKAQKNNPQKLYYVVV